MKPFKDFERAVVKTLVKSHLPVDAIDAVLDFATFVSYDYTGAGYYLTVRHPSLPSARVVCDTPLIRGTSGTIGCGFVVFLENGELTLECHNAGPQDVPEDFRERRVEIAGKA